MSLLMIMTALWIFLKWPSLSSSSPSQLLQTQACHCRTVCSALSGKLMPVLPGDLAGDMMTKTGAEVVVAIRAVVAAVVAAVSTTVTGAGREGDKECPCYYSLLTLH